MVNRNILKAIVSFTIIFLVGISLYGRLKPDAKEIPLAYNSGLTKGMANSAPTWQLSWIGSGYLTQYTISNVGQNGYFEPPVSWEYYDGTYPTGLSSGNGYTGEFPAGTEQYYVWAAGLWIGGRSEYFDSADDDMLEIDKKFTNIGVIDSLYDPTGDFARTRRVVKNVRVAATAYYSDQSAISQLWQSDQRVNAVSDGFSSDYKGEYRFGQKNKNIDDYQEVWSYFIPGEGDYYNYTNDTIYRLDYKDINSRRQEVLLKNPDLDPEQILLDPLRKDRLGKIRGDIVSDEDSYAEFGDYIDERDGSFIFTLGYDIQPLGVKVTQRTYSWRIDDYIYFNYKIKNMNDFPLYDVFVGYFMDNDLGDATDDMIGFDRDLNLGYSYDSDSQEQGWATSAGYVGSVFVETPRKYFAGDTIHTGNDGVDNDGDGLADESDEWEQIGLTGFQTWIRSDLGKSEGFAGDLDDPETDHLKYFELALQDTFEVYEEAQDVRQLAASGPFLELDPGEEINITIAIVAGESLSDLKSNAEDAIKKYENGYIGPEAPPSPLLSAQPAHNTVYLSWDDSPESSIDPYTGEEDFAGYRVYRSETGLQDDWELLAEYDISDDSTQYEANISYTIGNSNIDAVLDEVLDDDDIIGDEYDSVDDIFKESTYTIEFRELTLDINGKPVDTLCVLVYDVTKGQSLEYNLSAIAEGTGYTVYEGKYAKSYGPIYKSGVRVYFNGIYIKVTNGEYVDLDDDGEISDSEKSQQILEPQSGDVFEIITFKADDIGDQTGLEYSYNDEDLTDGITYYYAVTSYDRGNRTLEIDELESSKYENIINIIPQHIGVEYVGEPSLSSAEYTGTGNTTGSILKGITNYNELTGDTYEFQFFSNDPEGKNSENANYGIVIDKNLTSVNVVDEDVTADSDSTVWYGELGSSTIIPGSVILEFSGDYSGTMTDNDSSGALSGIESLSGVINYGTGEISITHDDNDELTTGLVASASYKAQNIILKNQYTKTKTGKLLFNSSKNTLEYIYEVLLAETSGDTVSHGFQFAAVSPKLAVDSVTWGYETISDEVFIPTVTAVSIEPYDYYIIFPEEGSISAFEEYNHKNGYTEIKQTVPFYVWNKTLDIKSRSWNPNFKRPNDSLVTWKFNNIDNVIEVLHEDTRADSSLSTVAIRLEIAGIYEDEDLGIRDTLGAPTVEDTLYIFTSRPLKINDKFEISTTNIFTRKDKISLKEVRVVPNPYYIRAAWDTDQYTQHIDFRHLPSAAECITHIRIFNLAGDMVAHLKKNDIVEENETIDEYGTVSWDLRNFDNLKVTSGLYLYHVEAKINGKKVEHTGKFCIVLGS